MASKINGSNREVGEYLNYAAESNEYQVKDLASGLIPAKTSSDAISDNKFSASQVVSRFDVNYHMHKKAVLINFGLATAFAGGAAYAFLTLGLAATVNLVAFAALVAVALIFIGVNAYLICKSRSTDEKVDFTIDRGVEQLRKFMDDKQSKGSTESAPVKKELQEEETSKVEKDSLKTSQADQGKARHRRGRRKLRKSEKNAYHWAVKQRAKDPIRV